MISYWGVEHGDEISKAREHSDNYKAAVYNRDMTGKDPRAKRNRQIARREQWKGQAKGAAAGLVGGAAAGAGGLAAARYGKTVASPTYKAGRAVGFTRGKSRETAQSALKMRKGSYGTTAVVGGAGGGLTGQMVGDWKGRKKAYKHPDYTKRGDKW
jgi:hypothetical protein